MVKAQMVTNILVGSLSSTRTPWLLMTYPPWRMGGILGSFKSYVAAFPPALPRHAQNCSARGNR